MRPRKKYFVSLGIFAASALVVVFGMTMRLTHQKILGFQDRHGWLSYGKAWTSYGGAWELSDGVMRDNSYERGAKLITGSKWSGDYKIEADIALVGSYGDAGLILRARDLAEGVDSYSGFDVSLRTLDNSLIIGRADYGWDEYQRLAIPGDIIPNHFYHLTVIAIGCDLGARVDLPGGGNVRAGISLKSCNHRGQVGLKSYQSPAAWKNFRVSPATQGDLTRLMAGRSLAVSNGSNFASGDPKNLHYYDPRVDERTPIEMEARSREITVHTTPISQLQLASSSPSFQYASVHGVVRLIKPVTYVEDSTGSIVISSYDQPALTIGDEIVIAGQVSRDGQQLELRNGHVQILWSDAPPPPILTTPDEAATGTQDGRFVRVTGDLIREIRRKDGSTVLELTGAGEQFRAIAAPATFTRLPSIRPSSEIQVTGVVRSDRKFAGNSAFGVLLTPTEDAIQVIREAPWWNGEKIAAAALGGVMLIALLAYFYHKLKERYLLQIMKERELLAHDLHDTMSQSLTGIGFQLDSAASHIESGDTTRAQIERARMMVRQSHEELRRSITTLRNQIAAIGDLAYALSQTAQRMIGDCAIQVNCSVSGTVGRLPVAVADCFFRIGQEAIANAIEHAGASTVSITLTYRSRILRMEIADDGVGFAPDQIASGHGLFGMKRRAEMIGAIFEVRPCKAHGMTISVEKHLPTPNRLFDNLIPVESGQSEMQAKW